MTASKPTNVLEGNLASEPKYRQAKPRSRMAMLGRRIVPDQIANAERALNAQRKDAMQWMTAAPAVTPVAQAAPGQTYVGGFAAPLM